MCPPWTWCGRSCVTDDWSRKKVVVAPYCAQYSTEEGQKRCRLSVSGGMSYREMIDIRRLASGPAPTLSTHIVHSSQSLHGGKSVPTMTTITSSTTKVERRVLNVLRCDEITMHDTAQLAADVQKNSLQSCRLIFGWNLGSLFTRVGRVPEKASPSAVSAPCNLLVTTVLPVHLLTRSLTAAHIVSRAYRSGVSGCERRVNPP